MKVKKESEEDYLDDPMINKGITKRKDSNLGDLHLVEWHWQGRDNLYEPIGDHCLELRRIFTFAIAMRYIINLGKSWKEPVQILNVTETSIEGQFGGGLLGIIYKQKRKKESNET